MAYFKRNKFSGIAPGVAPRLLAEQFGQEAENLDFESGRFAPLAIEGTSVKTLANSIRRSIWYLDSDSAAPIWLEWNEENISAVEGPIPDDTADRFYWTGESYPRMSTRALIANNTHYRLGVPAPSSAPTVAKSGTPDASMTAEETAYVYTFVTDFGEEGPPSAASAIVEATIKSGAETVTVGIPSYSGMTNLAFGTDAKKRIYRANVGSTNAQYQFVAEEPYASTSYTDSKESSQLGEVLPSLTWIGPPNDDTNDYPDGQLMGLTPVANGIFAGFSGKRLCLSESYLPHAWPVDYRITLENDIIAIGTTANGIVALTDGKPYFVTGVDPSAMTATQINLAQGCVNEKSVVDLGDVVLYAGPDGLCGISGTQGEVITRGLISPKQWNADFYPETIRAFEHEGTYVAFYTTGSGSSTVHGGWVYDPRASEAAISTLTTNAERRGGFKNDKTGELFVIVGNAVQPYRASTTTNRLGKWKSKKYVTAQPVSMSWVHIHADSYPSSPGKNRVRVWADGVVIADYKITKSGNVFTQETTVPSGISDASLAEPIMRLPSVLATEWEVEIQGYVPINEFCLAQTMAEIKIS